MFDMLRGNNHLKGGLLCLLFFLVSVLRADAGYAFALFPEKGPSFPGYPEETASFPPFKSNGKVPSLKRQGKILPLSWFGGMNACHFAAIDLDGDGEDDYLAFDRIGSRLRCFSSQWEWMPQAEDALPPVLSWIQTYDYDRDGRKDIFTFNGISGIAVYRNLSEFDGKGNYRLLFQKLTDGLPAVMFDQETPLYCTNEDYPVVADIDGDGDPDVLNFWVPSSGDFLLYYRNFAQEELSRSDTFLLRLEDWSWGCFVESEESNVIFLDSCSSRNREKQAGGSQVSGRDGFAHKAGNGFGRSSANPPKHAGSTLFAFRNPASGLFDIVLGDVGYPDLYYLQNGGTPEKAHIIKYDTFFPYTEAVCLYNFPVLSQIRYRDTLCYVYSPYETNPLVAEGYASVWRYRDAGSGPLYAPLAQKDFLQDRMLDVGAGAYPLAYDYDCDGLADLVVGNYGQKVGAYYDYGNWYTRMCSGLSLYRNVGTAENPAFEWVTDDFLGLSRYGKRALFPAFSDLDGDGQDEMVLGMEDGCLWLFRIGKEAVSAPEIRQAELLDSAYLGVALSGFSAPVFFDLDGDGRDDLVVGEKQHVWRTGSSRITKGSLTCFLNREERSGRERFSGFPGKMPNDAPDGGKGVLPNFYFLTDSLGGVDVIDRDFSNFGYSRPSFYRSADGRILLACGSENGEVFLYDSIEGNWDGRFRFLGKAGREAFAGAECSDFAYRTIRSGVHASPLLHDWDGDGYPDLVLGNQCGGLEYFSGMQWAVSDAGSVESGSETPSVWLQASPNPFRSRLRIEASRAGTFQVTGLDGRILHSGRLSRGETLLELGGLPPGFYLLRFRVFSVSGGKEKGAQVIKLLKL